MYGFNFFEISIIRVKLISLVPMVGFLETQLFGHSYIWTFFLCTLVFFCPNMCINAKLPMLLCIYWMYLNWNYFIYHIQCKMYQIWTLFASVAIWLRLKSKTNSIQHSKSIKNANHKHERQSLDYRFYILWSQCDCEWSLISKPVSWLALTSLKVHMHSDQ